MPDPDSVVIPEGPGAIQFGVGRTWDPGFAALYLEYSNAGPEGATRALLTATWDTFDRSNERQIEVELTLDDLRVIRDTAAAMVAAVEEDEG